MGRVHEFVTAHATVPGTLGVLRDAAIPALSSEVAIVLAVAAAIAALIASRLQRR